MALSPLTMVGLLYLDPKHRQFGSPTDFSKMHFKAMIKFQGIIELNLWVQTAVCHDNTIFQTKGRLKSFFGYGIGISYQEKRNVGTSCECFFSLVASEIPGWPVPPLCSPGQDHAMILVPLWGTCSPVSGKYWNRFLLKRKCNDTEKFELVGAYLEETKQKRKSDPRRTEPSIIITTEAVILLPKIYSPISERNNYQTIVHEDPSSTDKKQYSPYHTVDCIFSLSRKWCIGGSKSKAEPTSSAITSWCCPQSKEAESIWVSSL